MANTIMRAASIATMGMSALYLASKPRRTYGETVLMATNTIGAGIFAAMMLPRPARDDDEVSVPEWDETADPDCPIMCRCQLGK